MPTNQISPLAELSCFTDVAEYHPTVTLRHVGELHPGEILDERFLATEVISRSGMAMIFKAQDLHNGSADVALKVPHLACESDPGFFARFEREEKIGLELDHRREDPEGFREGRCCVQRTEAAVRPALAPTLVYRQRMVE